ncbi:hypothetical protein RND71_027556 [Anisodus tanguticus]|uniref:TF-B3 domain-containing protein n=1 Tax=Anisodus tanguticus TaxID=243964 RepID=A0AAE1RJH4_9SOLA|nr:hypothetical protein RND71_027556 [Anisodus tanguticus]
MNVSCRKWEDEMYWSHFQVVQFFQVLSGLFDQQLFSDAVKIARKQNNCNQIINVIATVKVIQCHRREQKFSTIPMLELLTSVIMYDRKAMSIIIGTSRSVECMEFIRNQFLPSGQGSIYVMLRVKENTWKAKFQHTDYGDGLTGGWKNFVLEKFLEEFDVCVFNLTGGEDGAIILDVNIFRVVEEVIPPSRVTPASSSRGRKPNKSPMKKAL